MNTTTDTSGATPAPSVSAKPGDAREARQSIWAFAGGKGGVGRSLLAANLGIQLARAGRRVVLIDLDLQGCNLPAFLGYQRLPRTLSDLASGKAALLSELACETTTAQLRIIGGLQRSDLRDDAVAFVRQVAGQFSTLAADHILIDCGSGRWPASVAAFAEATIGILVTTPEPVALESAYLFTESYLRWCVVRAVTGEKMSAIEARLKESGVDPGGLSFRSFMTRLEGIDSAARAAIAAVVRRTRLELLLNQVRTEADEEAAACLASGFRKCFGINLSTAGIIEHDLSVLQAVQKRRPLSQQYPNAASTKEISRAASRLLSVGVGPLRDPDEEWEDLEALDHYRVLEVVPKASPKEVQSAYQLLKKTYDPDTTCLSSLMDAPGLRDLQARIEAAYRTLIFLESRSDYDRRLLGSGALREDQVRGLHAASGAPGQPPAALELAGGHSVATPAGDTPAAPTAGAQAAAPDGSEPASGPDPAGTEATAVPSPDTPGPEAADRGEPQETVSLPTPGSGAELRETRQRLNLAVETIAEKTKIRRAYLQAIEEERFGDLPAAVFVRGFLREYARCLGLPGDEVTGLYMKRHRDWQESRGQSTDPAPPWSHN